MTSQALTRQQAVFLGGVGGRRKDRLRTTLIVSLILHACVLALFAGFRFKKHVERPLSAVQVSLVTAPTPAPETKSEPKVETPKQIAKPVQPPPIPIPPKPVQPPSPVQQKPAPVQSKPAPSPAPSPPPVQSKPAPSPAPSPPPVASSPAPVQAPPMPKPSPALVQPGPPAPTLSLPQPIPQTVKPSSSAPVRSKRDVMEDLLKDIELPPDAPKFGEITPTKPESRKPIPTKLERATERPPSELDAMLKKLKVPEMAPTPMEVPKTQPKALPVPPKVPSLSEDKELDRELKEFKPLQAPPIVKLPEAVREPQLFQRPPAVQQPVAKQQPPAVTASAPKVQKAPVTRMNIPGSSGSNPYLSRIQRLINNAWEAPPVDISGSALSVVVKFRLSRTGAISGVVIDQRSGNEYYDLAGRRAVLRVENYLPPFPADITEPYFDVYFTFAVGEGSG